MAAQPRATRAGGARGGAPPRRARAVPRDLRAAQQLTRQQKASIAQMIAAQMRSVPRGPRGGQEREQLFRSGLRSAQFAPRGHGYYDAYNNKCESVLLGASVGPATCIHGVNLTTVPGVTKVTGSYTYLDSSGQSLTGTVTTNKKLIIFNPGSSDNTLGLVIGFMQDPNNSANVVAQITNLITATQFGVLGPALKSQYDNASIVDGNPQAISTDPADRVESIPLRGSIRIKNVTENISVGGSVRVLRYNGSIRYWADPPGSVGHTTRDLAFNTPDVRTVLTLCDMIENSERTRHYGGKELQARHQINTHPADFIRSSAFESDVHFDEALVETRYNTVLILIDDFTSAQGQVGNTYEISAQVHRAGRFGPGTLLHAKAQNLHGQPAAHSKVTADESAKGSGLKPVMDKGQDYDPLG